MGLELQLRFIMHRQNIFNTKSSLMAPASNKKIKPKVKLEFDFKLKL
jgi:hypothetical protein